MKRWWPLVALATAQFVMVLDQSVMNVSISTLVEDFDTTVTTIQAVITLYCLVMAMFMLTGAKIGDIIGRRRAFVIGLVIYGCGSAHHRRVADRGDPGVRLVDPRGPRRRAGAPRARRADRRQLRGQRAQGRLRRHRRSGRRGHRDRPDPRRLGDDRAHLAHRVRGRGRPRHRDPGDEPVDRRRAARGSQATPRPRRHAPVRGRSWARGARRAAVEHLGLGAAQGLARRAVRLLADPLRHRVSAQRCSGRSWPGSAAARRRGRTRSCTSTW